MTDEEAKQNIMGRHGQKSADGWLAKRLIIVFERFRQRGLGTLEALEQAHLCYLASIGVAEYSDETGLYESKAYSGRAWI